MKTDSIFPTFKKTISRYRMIAPGDKVLAAFSGGPDSTALLHLLLELRRDLRFDLVLAHFNHRLRAAADDDERFVRKVAAVLGLPLVVKRRAVRAAARAHKLNLEEAARELRYEFLRETASRVNATKIATGHNLNDQAETILIRLLRGTGRLGLAGIFPVVDGIIIRPLIGISKEEIENYCRGKGQAVRRDETNRDKRLLRNKIRLSLIPYLEKHYEPGLTRKLGRLAMILCDDENALEDKTREVYEGLTVRAGGRLQLDGQRLSGISRGLARRVIRAFIAGAKGDLRRISFDDVECVLGLSDGQERMLPSHLVIRREGGFLFFTKQRPAASPYAFAWDGRRPLPIAPAGMTLSGKIMKRAPAVRPSFDDQSRCFCDAEKIRFPLLVRSRRDGDRYRPLGAPGRKKLKEILRAKKIAAAERGALPLICSGNDIVWVPGLPVAEAFKITERTKLVFRIDLQKIGKLNSEY
jgi:tRNA(Ile)-lysidine synthase